jgi:hypothetical protein
MQILSAQGSQASPEVPINENFESLDFAAYGAKRHPATTGLTWAFWGGRWGGTLVADGTVTLTNNTTNYVVADRATSAVSTSTETTNWNNAAAYARLYQITTSGGVVTAVQDHRAGPRGVFGPLPPPAIATVASASTIAIPIGQAVVSITGTTNIATITATGHSGARVTLVFAGALTVTDGSNLRLAGNFTSTADDTLTLVCDGTTWYEVARSVN